MFKFNKVTSTSLHAVRVRDIEGNRKSLYFDPATGLIRAMSSHDVVQTVDEELSVLDILSEEAPTSDLKEAFSAVIGREVEWLSYCSASCDYPWNTEPNAVRCGACGSPLIGYAALDSLNGLEFNLGRNNWDVVTKAFNLASAGKIKAYTSTALDGIVYRILLGWDNQFAFKNSGTTTFRGKVNRAVLSEVGGEGASIPIRGQWEGMPMCFVHPVEINAGFLRFVDDYGDRLVNNPKESVDPAREAMARANYIHNAFINGTYYTQAGHTMKPETRFSSLLYKANPEFSKSEVAIESAWEVYCQALDTAGKATTIHTDGTISWRFMEAIDAITPEALHTFLIDRYAADPDEVAFLLTETPEVE